MSVAPKPLNSPDLEAALAADPMSGPSQLAVDAAITTRHSMRAFLPTPVAPETVRAILAVAARAPSGTNTQPWKVRVVTGATRQRLTQAILEVHHNPEMRGEHQEEYRYYPAEWVSPYIDRRRKVGWDLYGLLGIGKQDKERMHTQHGRNYVFFDAPVGLIFTIDRIMGQGSWLDYGMFLQNIMVAARGRGLHTCPQQAFCHYHQIIRTQLDIPLAETVVCGMALGHADPTAAENTLVTERALVSEFAHFHD